MRIGIMTCWQSDDNYGQQMQMFALQHYLRSKGHDAFLIRFSPNNASIMQTVKAGIKQPIKIIVKHFSKTLIEKMQLETELKQLSGLNLNSLSSSFLVCIAYKRTFKGEHQILEFIGSTWAYG